MMAETGKGVASPVPTRTMEDVSVVGAIDRGRKGTKDDADSTTAKTQTQYGSIPNKNATEQKKTKAENDSSTPKSWWRSVFSFCIWTPDENSPNGNEKNKLGDSHDRSKLNSSPTSGEIKTKVNRLSPHQPIASQSSSVGNGRKSPLDNDDDDDDDDGGGDDASSQAGSHYVLFHVI